MNIATHPRANLLDDLANEADAWMEIHLLSQLDDIENEIKLWRSEHRRHPYLANVIRKEINELLHKRAQIKIEIDSLFSR